MAHIFCTKTIPLKPLERLRQAGHTIEVWDDYKEGPITSKELENKAKLADALITMLCDNIDASFLEKNSHLKIIAQFAVGHNNIDLKACKKHKIIVTNTPDVLTHATAEMSLALLLTCSRNIPQAINNAKRGEWKGWEPMGFLGRSLKNSKVGIIGAGRIGKEFGSMCEGAFNSEVFYYSRSYEGANRKSLEQIFSTCDVISIHTPLNDQTYNMINYDLLSRASSKTILINTARGEIINQSDLIKCLEEKKYFSVGLDVTTPEPLSSSHPLYNFERVHITPHIASATEQAREAMSDLVVTNILNAFLGQEVVTAVTN